MATKIRIGVLAWGLAALLPALAFGQDAPIPMPRPADRMPQPEVTEPAAPEASQELTAAAAVEAALLPRGTATEALAAVAAEKQKVVLTAQITENGMNIPEGLVWRVFDTHTDASGELPLAAKSEEATATFELVPGQYVVHVAYGRAQATQTLEVTEGGTRESIVLDAGALRLNAAVTGDIGIPINLLRFDVFTAGTGGERTLVAQNLAANDIVTLNAGTYHVVSYFGGVNAVVRADLRVEPGQLTDATLYHRAAQIGFKLVTEPGGEAIADVEWTVKTADGKTVFSEIGAFPATVLAEGDYLVLAKRGDTVYNREFQVQPGPSREIEVLTTVY
ncbi:MAG TPA: hypothetical protein GYA10_00955 [Alphaproteobacteria bacterium]|nr:hypothetical protein [Alphaproteobacteria bacterium]